MPGTPQPQLRWRYLFMTLFVCHSYPSFAVRSVPSGSRESDIEGALAGPPPLLVSQDTPPLSTGSLAGSTGKALLRRPPMLSRDALQPSRAGSPLIGPGTPGSARGRFWKKQASFCGLCECACLEWDGRTPTMWKNGMLVARPNSHP